MDPKVFRTYFPKFLMDEVLLCKIQCLVSGSLSSVIERMHVRVRSCIWTRKRDKHSEEGLFVGWDVQR
jgi:hypothetical protein